jgi:formylglycine-generating enzyme required for sulfatase activity
MRKIILPALAIVLLALQQAPAQQPRIQGKLKELFAGPAQPSVTAQWLTGMKQWRMATRDQLRYEGSLYLRPQLGWLKNTFIYVQMMACDRYFYDPVAGRYTVDRYLDDLEKQYGGVDAVLIWPTYPNMGVDDRNQFDLVADMPGGKKAVRQMIEDFKRRGVRVFFPIMIWDRGTRKCRLAMPLALVREMKDLGADGMNGDTMWGVSEDFSHAADSLGYPLVLQPEVAIKNLKMVEWNTSSWGYYWNYKRVPGVSIYKWLEPRHQVFVTNRWAVNKTNDLQYAFFNGIGYNAWENIWGVWNQIAPRYEAAIRRIATIYRAFPGIWNSEEWRPFFPTLQKNIFASRFPGLDKTIYTLVNRDSTARNGEELSLPDRRGMVYFDLWNGVQLKPSVKDGRVRLTFPVEGHGFGAVLAIRSYAVTDTLRGLLQRMHTLSAMPLAALPAKWSPLPQHIVPIEKTPPARKAPAGMVLIPAASHYLFATKGIMIEGDPMPEGVGVQYPWEEHPSRSQQHYMDIPAFYMDKYPVTNRQFKAFLQATRYHPRDDHNFLKDWKNGSYPKGWADKPVTWISLEDARAYARWAHKRLPHEWEWQYAAQGTDNRLYPWGNDADPSRVPPPDTTRDERPPTNVDAYPKGASPFGVMDLMGNVWQWTDEYTDEHTRAAVVKGGGYYRASGSKWYFPRAVTVNAYGKYLLMAPSIDRSATIGFRCVRDK